MQQELSKEELLDKIEEATHNYERDYHGCSRCVVCSLQEHLNLGNGSAFLASTPLAGGIVMMGDTCGALLGGLLVVGLATASQNMEDEAALMKYHGKWLLVCSPLREGNGKQPLSRHSDGKAGAFL